MTEEGFRKYLRPYIEEGTPFSAYWHPKGFGLIKTGLIPRTKHEYVFHDGAKTKNYHGSYTSCRNAVNRTKGAWMETVEVPDKPKQITEGMKKRWQKNAAQLRASCYSKFITVEFDGTNTMIEGGFEL